MINGLTTDEIETIERFIIEISNQKDIDYDINEIVTNTFWDLID